MNYKNSKMIKYIKQKDINKSVEIYNKLIKFIFESFATYNSVPPLMLLDTWSSAWVGGESNGSVRLSLSALYKIIVTY